MEFLSKNSEITKLAKFDTRDEAYKAAQALADSENREVSANVIIGPEEERITIPAYPSTNAGDQNASLTFTEDRLGTISDPGTAAQLLANSLAAKRKSTTKVTVNGVEATAQPPARSSDIKNAAKGTPGTTANTNMEEPDVRTTGIKSFERARNLSTMDGGGSLVSSKPVGGSSFEKSIQYGIPRNFGGRVSSLEGVLDGVSAGALKGVLNNLPPTFKSLLPVGALPGILSSSPIPLNNIMQIATGNVLGAVSGQAIRSLSGGIGAVSGLTTALGAVAISQVTTSAMGPKPRGYSPSNAVLSNVLGSAVTKSLVGNSYQIPVSRSMIGSVANVSLNSYNRNVGIPTNVLGVAASNAAFSGISNMIGGSVSGRVPILPTNLSLGAITGGSTGIAAAIAAGGIAGALGSISGLSQKLNQGDVANMFSPGAIANALPRNVSGLLNSAIPPYVSNPFGEGPNDIQSRRMFSPSQRTNIPTGNQRPPVASPSGEIMKGGNVDYDLVISPGGRTLGELVFPGGRKGYRLPPDGQLGYSLQQIVDGLKYIATNVIDPLDRAFGKGTITNGFRGPGGSNYPDSDHCVGAAVDLSWSSALKHYEVSQYVAKYIKNDQVLMEFKYSGDKGHVHIAAGPNVRNKNKSPKVGSSFDDGRSIKQGLQRPNWA